MFYRRSHLPIPSRFLHPKSDSMRADYRASVRRQSQDEDSGVDSCLSQGRFGHFNALHKSNNKSIFRVDESSSADNIIAHESPERYELVKSRDQLQVGRCIRLRLDEKTLKRIWSSLTKPSIRRLYFVFFRLSRLHIKHFSQKAVNYNNISYRTLEKGVLLTRKWLVLEL
jgi:hypothetical protein